MVKLNDKSLQHEMLLTYSTTESLFFNIIPKKFDASTTPMQQLRNSIVALIRLLHLQQFMDSHFHSLIFLQFVTSQKLPQ
jgi:hypothetical protein